MCHNEVRPIETIDRHRGELKHKDVINLLQLRLLVTAVVYHQ